MLRALTLTMAVALLGLSTSTAVAADRYQRVNEAVSPYLGEMIDRPAAAHDQQWIARTNAKLDKVARGAPRACRRQIARVRSAVAKLGLNAKAKRKRILDAAAPTYYRC
jgi:hypothetical protein